MRAPALLAALAVPTLLAGALLAQVRPSVRPPARSSRDDDALRLRTEQAIARGLEWLAREQKPQGFWVGDEGHKQEDDYVILHSIEQEEHDGTGHPGVSA